MGGPMSDYRLGRIFHREYETQVSCYWGRELGPEKGFSLAKQAKELLDRAGDGLRRVRCSVTRVGLSSDRCEAAG